MIRIGQLNRLKIVKFVDFGLYLDEGDGVEILLPTREIPNEAEVGQELDVFIVYDSEDRLIATTRQPLAAVGDFALLKVVAVEEVGAFLDWGLPKDLFLPHREQSRSLRVGQRVLVYLYLDSSQRIAASMRLERNTDPEPGDYKLDQEVDLLIIGKTDLGYKAIIENRHLGVIYQNEVFQELEYGQRTKGFIKKIREDRKIDLALQRAGMTDVDTIVDQILDQLRRKGGFLELNDKASADLIHDLFGVSKKKYKIALGGLYKKRWIQVDDDGIRLTELGKTQSAK